MGHCGLSQAHDELQQMPLANARTGAEQKFDFAFLVGKEEANRDGGALESFGAEAIEQGHLRNGRYNGKHKQLD